MAFCKNLSAYITCNVLTRRRFCKFQTACDLTKIGAKQKILHRQLIITRFSAEVELNPE